VVIGYGLSIIQDWVIARFRRPDGEEGLTRLSFSGVAMFVIVVLVAYAAIASQRAANEANETSETLKEAVSCLATTTFQVNNAVVERSAGSRKQTKSNVKLQKAFSDFLAIFVQDEQASPEVAGQALRDYYAALLKFIQKAHISLNAQVTNPYPVPADLLSCLHEGGVDITLQPKSDTGNQNSEG
jgi:hypothetical protein